jgi:two-component system, NtrC family, response regulator
MQKTILVIDDEEKLRLLLTNILELEGFAVIQANSGKSALKKLEHHDVDVILCDVKLPDCSGVDFVTSVKKLYPLTEIVLLTAFGNIPDGVQAIKNGAFDYITKGDDNEKIIPLMHRAVEKVDLSKRVIQLEEQLHLRRSFSNVLGSSPAIQAAISLAKRVATTPTTVLLTGETGTGKEIFAKAIHRDSPRAKKNFVAINCSAFSRDLLESELFGYKAGAFTGAVTDHVGLFVEASGGTIFLDEIGDMPIELQAKLLRVIESGEFYRVGDSKLLTLDVRVIAATHKNLLYEVEQGRFREDLYYRVSTFVIHLPPLRERVADIQELAEYFVLVSANKSNKRISTVHPTYYQALQVHEWKGNIRELKNVVERSVILCDDTLLVDHLPVEFHTTTIGHPAQKILSAFELASAEKLHIQKVLNYTNGNKTKAAELLGIALTTLYRKLSEFGIE